MNDTMTPAQFQKLAKGKGRRRTVAKDGDGMNKTERAYAAHLHIRKAAGEIREFRFEAVRLRLADDTTYSPDFMVTLPSGDVQFHEVKASWKGKVHWEDDARVKFKMAAEIYPEFTFVAAWSADARVWEFEYR